MATCTNCGKKSLFLRVNARGLCSECQKLAITPSKPIVIVTEHNSIGHQAEEDACNYFISELTKLDYDAEKFKIEHRSNEYTSLFYGLSDILRIKITSNIQWVSIPLVQEDRVSNEIFEINGNSLFCKSYIKNTNDLSVYIPYLSRVKTCEKYGNTRELTEKEKTALQYVYDILVRCGAAELDKFYLYTTSAEVELIYISLPCSVKMKIHLKKQGGYITNNLVKNDKNRLVFTELSEIDDLVKKVYKEYVEIAKENEKYHHMENYEKYIPHQ